MKRLEIDNHPLTTELGQMEHQTVLTSHGSVVDHNEVFSDVVDPDGLTVLPEKEAKLQEYIKSALSLENFMQTFDDDAEEALLKLLALQNNAHPLKKGGVNIAYRTDALIMHCKMEFSAEENVVFDAILGKMSSYPQDKVYRIDPAEFIKYSRYSNPKYLYTVFKNGQKKLKNRDLVFDLGPEIGELNIPWKKILRYHPGKGKGLSEEDSAFIEFVPSNFFKALALGSGIIHGAFGKMEVTTQLQGKYTIAIYWFLENRKHYREYQGATEGVFDISMDELKERFNIPQSYAPSDMKRRVLDPAKNSINSVEECDFTFDYKKQMISGATVGYRFTVQTKKYIEVANDATVAISDPMFSQIKMFLDASGIVFTDQEVEQVYSKSTELGKDVAYIMQVIIAFKQRLDNPAFEPVVDKAGYLCKMIEQGLVPTYEKKKNQFNQYQQLEYDYDELEQKLLDN